MMNRQLRTATSLLLCGLTLCSGCTPIQPFYFKEDGDLSHYMDVATNIEYPDVNAQPIADVANAQAPLTLANAQDFKIWDLTLEEVVRLTLENSTVVRNLGGRINDGGQNISTTAPEALTAGGGNAITTYDAALTESGYGGNTGSQFSGRGVEAALSEFDAQLDSSLVWQKNDRPQNFGLAAAPNFFNPLFRQDTGRFTTGLTKTAANGSTFEARTNTNYDQNNNGSRTQPSDWFANVEAAVTQPLLQGAGTEYNRIAGPRSFQESSGNFSDQIDGVLIAKIRTDVTLTDFEAGVRDQMRDVEEAYWELYFCYRDLEARRIGEASALETWRKVKAKFVIGGEGGEANTEAQSRSQYFNFRQQVQVAQSNLFAIENRLRFLMGLSVSDGRLIRPADEPTVAPVTFDWATIHIEALARREEIRRQKWTIKRRELELIAAKNQLLPRLDLVGRYRWLGAGDDLIDVPRNGIPPFLNGSTAWESLTSGDFQEWEAGLQFSMPLGFRLGMTTVRHSQLLLARERAVLQDMELSISHQLGQTIRDLDLSYGTTQTNFNQRAAAEDDVQAVAAIYASGRVTIDLLLQAQQRRAQAESAYYRSLVDYNRAIMRVHWRKGSLLEYNGIYLQEGPWPGKAYFDATRRARRRDAAMELDYGFTRPNVMSRGVYNQTPGTAKGAAWEGPVPTIVPEPIAPAPSVPQASATSTSEFAPASEFSDVGSLAELPAVSTMEPASAPAHPTTTPAAGVAATGAPQTAPMNPFPRSDVAPTVVVPAGSAAASSVPNPFGAPQPLPAATAPSVVGESAAYEPQANYATTQTAADAAGWTGGQR
ncbi:Outer membrane efflux protein [Lacipirellula limnantheis]|uniref:Outer membrane efflux protein n=2 Tax=Lacipirellula limnantheis TaxID=2528024 RepID=A0A517TU69_9BACT|nr:Outer membrane efflux protein [Lacipirellula limnantheis]